MFVLTNEEELFFSPKQKDVNYAFLVILDTRKLLSNKNKKTRLETFALLLKFYSNLKDCQSRAIMRYVMDGNSDHVEPYKIMPRPLRHKAYNLCRSFVIYYLAHSFDKPHFPENDIALCIAGALKGEDSCYFKQFSLNIADDEVGFVQHLADVTGFFDTYTSWLSHSETEEMLYATFSKTENRRK